MISILAQERVLGAVLGSILTGVVVFEQRRHINNSILKNTSQLASPSQEEDSYKGGIEIAHEWNKGVDQVFGPVVKYFASHGW